MRALSVGRGLSSVEALRGTALGPVAASRAAPRSAPGLVVEAKKSISILKRQRQAEKRRMHNRSIKSACKTRIKNAMSTVALSMEENLPKSEADLAEVDALISKAYKALDSAQTKGLYHKNMTSRKKSQLAKARNDLCIAAGLYTP